MALGRRQMLVVMAAGGLACTRKGARPSAPDTGTGTSVPPVVSTPASSVPVPVPSAPAPAMSASAASASAPAAPSAATTPQPSGPFKPFPPRSKARPPAWLSKIDRRDTPFTLEFIAELVMPSGELLACDPLVFMSNDAAFADAVPPGRYPVHVGYPHDDASEFYFAMLRFQPGRPKTWELAVSPRDDTGKVARGVHVGYPVDAGTGCFVDRAVARRILADERADDRKPPGVPRTPDLLERLRDAGYKGKQGWASLVTDRSTGGNLVVFRPYGGDGSYASYWGLDEQRRPVALVTEFTDIDAHADE